MNMNSAYNVLEVLLNHMLAPSSVAEGPMNTPFVKLIDRNEIELRIRWSANILLTTPEHFIRDFERILRPISEAITYGEVRDLRKENEKLRRQLESKDKELVDMRRYRDAVELLGGRR